MSQRFQALALATLLTEFKITQIMVVAILGISQSSVSWLIKQAKEQKYNSSLCLYIKLEYITDPLWSGWPLVVTPELEQTILDSLNKAIQNDIEKLTGLLVFEHRILPSSILCILNRNKFRSVKPTYKPGLTNEIKAAYLKFCLDYEH